MRMSQSHPSKNRGDSKTRLAGILASAGAALASTGETLAADFYNSGPISSNNTVGWSQSLSTLASFPIQLKTNQAIIYRYPITYTYRVLFALGNSANFRVARSNNTALINAAQIFEAYDNWASAASDATFGNVLRVDTGIINRPQTPAAVDKYLLFKFKDNAEDYYGWVRIDYENKWNGSFSNLTQYVTVKSYAWQKGTFGIIQAGATAVPEPSTLVSSGLAALAGGAAVLRRWRKERKANTPAA